MNDEHAGKHHYKDNYSFVTHAYNRIVDLNVLPYFKNKQNCKTTPIFVDLSTWVDGKEQNSGSFLFTGEVATYIARGFVS